MHPLTVYRFTTSIPWQRACSRFLLGLALITVGVDESAAQTNYVTNNPALENLRNATYDQPQQSLSAISKLLDLGEVSLAKEHLERLAKENLNAKQLASLHRQFGTALFLRLSSEPELQPVGQEWARGVMDAAAQLARDPGQLAKWVQQLAGAELPAERYAAIVELRAVGADAVGPLLAAITQETDAQDLAWLRKGLTELGHVAVQPLLATLSDQPQPASPAVREQVILALGELNAERAVPYLVRPYLSGGEGERAAASAALEELLGTAPSEPAALQLLASAVQRQLEDQGALTLERHLARDTRVWRWLGSAGLRAENHSFAEAMSLRAAQLASDLHRLRPQRTDYRNRYLLAQLQTRSSKSDQAVVAHKASPEKLLAGIPLAELDGLLALALDTNLDLAAERICNLLGSVGTPARLEQTNGRRSPLAKALRHTNRRVRFAAARAIVHLDPMRPFPGAADLVHAAEFFASSQATRRVLIVHPRDEEAMAIAGWFENLGWAAEAVATPRNFLKAGQRHADYELLLISDRVDRPTAGELLQLVRRDPRTAEAAVVMMACSADLARAARWAAGDERTIAFPLPQSEETVRGLVQQTVLQRLSGVVSVAERLAQAQTALEWFERWSANRRRYHFLELLESQPVIRDALAVPALSALAAQTLGNLGTPAAQQALLDSASQLGQTLALRQAAAEGFRRAVQQQGVQLTRSAILEQYARYNQSASFDEATQRLLGQILDTIESPSQQETM